MMGKQEGRQIEDLLPRTVFAVDKPHTADELFAADDLGVGINPLAGHGPTHVARGALDYAALAYALRFARICGCVDIELRSVGSCSIRRRDFNCKPDRGPDTLATFAVGPQTQILFAVECGEYH